ncbi:MAG: immunoglobulin domain-containing protein [Verrucomicrobia bacterium]|nr:immunoglobulin domain-containing protein [Verrucomicrobiota bacterium]
MNRFHRLKIACLLAAAFWVGDAVLAQNILQPGDPIIASSANSPGSEAAPNAIDGKPTKYLNFDTRNGAAGKPSGFVVTPSVGVTRIVGISMQSANDAPERDPKVVTIEGSNDANPTWDTGNWELIAQLNDIPAWSGRFEVQTFSFPNLKPYRHYRWTVVATQSENGCCMQVAEVSLLGSLLPQNIVQPGDPILASSANSPGSEAAPNAIDGKPTKYLNFDTRNGAAGKPSGFVVTPSLGSTVVTGITMQSANDAPERDPKTITIEGSNDEAPTWDTGTWEQIYRNDAIPAWPARFEFQTFLFDNFKPFKHYRWTVVATQTDNGCCMQVAEVALLGTGAPANILQPSDSILASSANSPGSEGVANAIDNKPTKYLNFDTRNGAAGKPSGFVVTPGVGATIITGIAMQSANDSPERDPKFITIEGSNSESPTWDTGSWELVYQNASVPAWTERFQWQELFFANSKSYKHYRWTVVETQTANGCCMQIAEVALLAVTDKPDCDKTRILVQPVDTYVLPNQPATFFVTVNGPWPLQWYKNDEAIPGATRATYTTEPITAANANDLYTVKIVGCEESRTSTVVKAILFTPSSTKSIGISFIGGGANGAPTSMTTNDIAGIQLQAHWNNASGASGDLPDFNADPPVPLRDSDGNESTLTFNYSTSGTWGSGTGDQSATARMLNGLTVANPGAPQTLTFSSVPAGTHSIIAYLVGIPLQFQNANYTVVGKTTSTYYVRVINADEYNAAPGFYRGVSTNPNSRDLATYVRFDNVEADAAGTIQLQWETLTPPTYDRGAPVNAIQLLLNSTPAPPPPAITLQPQPTTGLANGQVSLSVTATGTGLTYQWRKNGRNLPDGGNISGATTSTLVISNLSPDDEAIYNVAIFNTGGSVVSRNASVSISQFAIDEALVGYWKFDQSSGGSAVNSVAGGSPATVTGSASWVQGQIANAFGFDGASYLFVDNYAKANRALSVSGWVNVAAGVGADVSFVRNAIGGLGVNPAGQFELGLIYDANTFEARLSAAIGSGPNIVRATAPGAFPTGAWQQVAFTADGAQVRLYLNGVEVASADYQGAINAPAIPWLSMGARLSNDDQEPPVLGPDGTNPNYLTGPLDDLGIWNRRLSAEEVSQIFTIGKAGKPLTDVVITPPSNPTFTGFRVNPDGSVTVSWTGGILEASGTLNGTYVPTGLTSPATFTPATPNWFGRVRN